MGMPVLHMRKQGAADQRLCFGYIDRTVPLLLKFQAPSQLLWLYSLVCVRPGRNPRRQVFA